MQRNRERINPIIGPGKDPDTKLLVQKSRPLFSLWRSDMTLAEFKILDTYLSRIDSKKPNKRTVIFSKGELEQLLGVTRINKSDLSNRLNNLGRFVEIEKSDHRIHKVALFEEAYGEMDKYGLWQVKLTCTPSAMQYIFNIESLGYLRYKLRCITSLSSRYSYILFMYLESNRFRKTWQIDVDELKKILNCEKDDLYKEFKFFNQRILRKSQKELHDKSECRFAYEPIKNGRKVSAVKFTLETLADEITKSADAMPGQIPLDDATTPLLQSACNNEFTGAELDAIEAILRDAAIDPGQYGIEIARYHVLEKAYKSFLVAADRAEKAGKPIKHRFTYFAKLLEQKLHSETEKNQDN